MTPAGIQLFQVLADHEGEDFDSAREAIDDEYLTLRGRDEDLRHGGKIQTAISVYREAGWVELKPENGRSLIALTPAGKQALILFTRLPDFLKAIPWFVLKILAKYQLNNPARPDQTRDISYEAKLAGSDVFPYWTLFKIIRAVGDEISAEELKRFVFQMEHSDQIPGVIGQIKSFRKDVAGGATEEELNRKYPPPLSGAIGETKYIMGRLGTQVGNAPSVLTKPSNDRWRISEAYLPFIDELLSDRPDFQEEISEGAWMERYGAFVDLSADLLEPDDQLTWENDLADTDPVWLEVKALLDHGSAGVVLSGPPGTSKTWYASKIAAKIADGDSGRLEVVQFHPSYSYDDFMEGYVPIAGSSSPDFELKPKVFLRLAARASAEPEKVFVLIIDELTRGDVSRILGEALTYIEPEYRGRKFSLAYSGRRVQIPPNLVIIATMNPYDKSVTELDDALERRLDRVALQPNLEILRTFIAKVPQPLNGKIIEFFVAANKLAPHGLGHTFFLGIQSEADLIRLWKRSCDFSSKKHSASRKRSYRQYGSNSLA